MRVEAHVVTVVVNVFYPLKKLRLHGDVVTMGGKERRDFFCNVKHLLVAHALHEVEKDAADLVEHLTRLVECQYCVLESRSRGVVADAFNLRLMMAHALFEGRHVMLRLYLVESRRLEWCPVIGEERVLFAARIVAAAAV